MLVSPQRRALPVNESCYENLLVESRKSAHHITRALQQALPMGETAGRMRMTPALGSVNCVHQPEPAGRKIGQDEFATRFQDAKHFAEYACWIVKVVKDILGHHAVEGCCRPREEARVVDQEANAVGHAGANRLQPGWALLLGADIHRGYVRNMPCQWDDEPAFARADVQHASAQLKRFLQHELHAGLCIETKAPMNRVTFSNLGVVGLNLCRGNRTDPRSG